MTSSEEPVVSEQDEQPIYTCGDFACYLGEGEIHSLPSFGVLAYRIYNMRTGLCEGEYLSEALAIRACHKLDEYLKEVLNDPSDKAGKAQEMEALREHREFMASMQSGNLGLA